MIFACAARDVVGHAHHRHRARLGVEDAERRTRVAVARLADGAAVDQILRLRIERQPVLRAARRSDRAQIRRRT